MSTEPRVALVTGGGSGIGAGIARRLAAGGFAVCVTGRREGPLATLADELGGTYVVADTGVSQDAERAVGETVARLGGLDALVCNAGISRPGNAVEQTPEGWDEVLRTNLTGAFLAAHFALPHLERRRGCVVTVGSLAGLRASTDSVAYNSSKAGLAMLTRCLAMDHGPRGVRANCVAPGWVRTPMADRSMDGLARSHTMTRDDAYALAARHIPTRRPASVDEVAALVAWLCGPEAGSVNGAVIPVDGGAHAVDVASLELAP
jgi:meso-butanediol dehydrogenase / (S,S)-butanediol dehydrogenase / diacetyl reductase